MTSMVRSLAALFAALLLFVATCTPARAAGANGLWVPIAGDDAVFMQDAASGSTLGFQVPGSLDSVRFWLGGGSSTALNLQALLSPQDTLSVTFLANTMTGHTVIDGLSRAFDVSLALAWVPTAYAGVWPTLGAGNQST